MIITRLTADERVANAHVSVDQDPTAHLVAAYVPTEPALKKM